MEGGAKGQLGGMEMGEAERKRLAEESKGWRCTACGGKSNEEILDAQGEGDGDRTANSKADVPEDLRFGFKDEMQKQEKDDSVQTTSLVEGNADGIRTKSAQFPATPGEQSSSTPVEQISSNPPATQPPSTPNPNMPPLSQQRVRQGHPAVQASPREAVPGWIDKAIVGIVGTLLVMIIKKFMA